MQDFFHFDFFFTQNDPKMPLVKKTETPSSEVMRRYSLHFVLPYSSEEVLV